MIIRHLWQHLIRYCFVWFWQESSNRWQLALSLCKLTNITGASWFSIWVVLFALYSMSQWLEQNTLKTSAWSQVSCVRILSAISDLGATGCFFLSQSWNRNLCINDANVLNINNQQSPLPLDKSCITKQNKRYEPPTHVAARCTARDPSIKAVQRACNWLIGLTLRAG